MDLCKHAIPDTALRVRPSAVCVRCTYHLLWTAHITGDTSGGQPSIIASKVVVAQLTLQHLDFDRRNTIVT